ncbi:pyridoxal phosphate-dependent aminotransferase [Pseudoflavonifractor sp. MSJ-37]|uniref:pyridoxal phosphate-dependent aminotransferase n=1 Tax=Pseudoflavonifractor sp. MSJ-37 TaxID=2841531 RepID=UPI001C11A998|nr:aminotransferase class I/II-fold pyridoxal phosphate-dependent enzyme [Pseudoflavonifractor sp. MSJ-37]MBU5435249.1 aminotransferase class I/II-fold pyridoxal phosphate-dependent enzyme [Pseudoflavonifractor sp. MSJ-37]
MKASMNEAVVGMAPSAIRRFTALARATPGCISLALGEPELDTPAPIKAAAAAALAAGQTHYPPNVGFDFLRKAIVKKERGRGLRYDYDETIVTIGATEGLYAAMMAVLEPGDEVLLPTPAFGLYASIAALCRAKVVTVPTEGDGFQLRRDRLRAACGPRTKLMILTSPNNPTGCVYTRESLEAAADVARETGSFVLCDDVYADIAFGDCPGFAASFPHLREQVIVVNSFSKPYAMTGWRMGWVMAQREVMAQIAKVHQFTVVSAPSFAQWGCAEALEQDVSDVRESYRRRRDLVYRRLTEAGLEVKLPQGAFYAFPSIARFGMSSEEFCRRLIEEGGVALVPGSFFWAEGYARLSYCCSEDQLAEGLDRIGRFVERL